MDPENKDNKPENDNKTKDTVTISVSDYNQLKALSGEVDNLRTQIEDRDGKLSEIQGELRELKQKKPPKPQPAEGPSKQEIEEQLRAEFAKTLSEAESKAADLEKRLKKVLVTDRVLAVVKDEIVPSAEKWLRQEIERECDLEGDFDHPTIIIRDDKGNPRWSTKKPDQKMDSLEYKEVLQSRYPEFFRSTARGGESNPGNNVTNRPPQYAGERTKLNWQDVERMSDEELRSVDVKELQSLVRL